MRISLEEFSTVTAAALEAAGLVREIDAAGLVRPIDQVGRGELQ
jgi:hypothetical protein